MVGATFAEPADLLVTQPGGAPGTFASIQAALDRAQAGDTIIISPGIYRESLRTIRAGRPGNAIRLRSEGPPGTSIVTSAGRVLAVRHADYIVEGLVFDGQYGAGDTVTVGDEANNLVLREVEVRRSSRDLVDIGGPSGVLIERCLIHHALNASRGRTDAHGIAAGPVRNLVIRDTEIHTFSGDGLQVDPSRATPGWDNVLVENTRFWLAPLGSPENGFAAGTVPGENAIDTKTATGVPRPTLTLRNVTARGFRGGLVPNMAAFKLKENVDVLVDGVTVSESEIAFRVRGPAGSAVGLRATFINAVVFDVATAFRYEDGLTELRVWNLTVGTDVNQAFRMVGRPSAKPDVRNSLFLRSKPAEAADGSNLLVAPDAFVDVTHHDYSLASGSPAVDAGAPLDLVRTDRNGIPRPVGKAPDVGAFEWTRPGGR